MWSDCEGIEGPILPCFQALLPESGIYMALEHHQHCTEILKNSSSQRKTGGLTCWSSTLDLLLGIIRRIVAIYRVGMGGRSL